MELLMEKQIFLFVCMLGFVVNMAYMRPDKMFAVEKLSGCHKKALICCMSLVILPGVVVFTGMLCCHCILIAVTSWVPPILSYLIVRYAPIVVDIDPTDYKCKAFVASWISWPLAVILISSIPASQ